MAREVCRYGEVFKRQVIEELGSEEFTSAFEAQQACEQCGPGLSEDWEWGPASIF